ncbi:tetratricopeptide repeat protein [Dongia mobilis]|uniref:Tetratricopeptide repeat protein n=1 Tax=Dongia mobilis TaxID=578943 RepID=A0A4R6WQG6_9PROT|nr:tetratricopeptide repeat protein [Dongia mobilis]TDQ78772.1 tetratricopeptide repeat protein [Dongia mobilis]
MRRIVASLLLVALSIAGSLQPAIADEAAAKQAFLACAQARDLTACDEFIDMPDLSDTVRSNGYAVRGMVKMQLGDIAGAEADLSWALAVNPNNDLAQRALDMMANSAVDPSTAAFQACAKERNIAERIAACDDLVKQGQSDPLRHATILDLRAAAFLENNESDKAIIDLNEAIRLAPTYDPAAEHLIVAQFWAGKYVEALQTTNNKLKSPGGLSVANLLHHQGNLLYLTGKKAEAIAAYDNAHENNPMSAVAYFWSAIVRLEQGDDAESILRALSLQPMLGQFGMTMAKFRLGEASEADVLAQVNAIVGEAKYDALCMAHFNIGHKAWLEGSTAEAELNFKAAVATGRKRTQEYHAAELILQQL